MNSAVNTVTIKENLQTEYSPLTYKQIKDINWFIADTIRDHGNGSNEDTKKVALPLLTAKRNIDLRAEYKENEIYTSIEFLDEGILYALKEHKHVDSRFSVKDSAVEFFDIEWNDIIQFPDNVNGDTILYKPYRADKEKQISIETNARNKIEFLFEVISAFDSEVFQEFSKEYEFEKAIMKLLKPEWINHILNELSKYKLDSAHAPDDVFADAYMDLTSRFASEGGKKGGEFFTPSILTQGGINILNPTLHDGKITRFADPTAGACTFMTYAGDYLKEKNPSLNNRQFNQKVEYVTQEKEKGSEILGKLNMEFHGFGPSHKSFHGNTITEWEGNIANYEGRVDYVFANPPYSLNDYGHEYATLMSGKEPRWAYGVPKKGKGTSGCEYAFLQTIVSLLNDTGRAFVLLPLGTLTNESPVEFRRKFLEDDLVEGIIKLPPSMFFTTPIQVCAWILNKNKSEQDRGKVFMINAENEFVKGEDSNVWNGKKDEKTVSHYHTRTEEEGFSKYVDFETLKANNYNLSVTRYVYTEEVRESIDIHILNKKIFTLMDEISRSSIETDKLFGGL